MKQSIEKHMAIFLVLSIIFYSSCSPQVRFGFHAWDSCSGEWGTEHAQAYFMLSDTVLISTLGVPFLCLEKENTIRILAEIGREGGNCENLNTINTEFDMVLPVHTISKINPYERQKCLGIIKLSTSCDTCKTALKNARTIEEGLFEFNGAANIYANLGNPDSLGIFATTTPKYKKYRMINGIEGDSLTLKKRGASYLFSVSDNGGCRRTHSLDSVYPLLCQGSLPDGIKRLTQTSWSDYIFQYKSGAAIWIHLRPNAAICNINHPAHLHKQQALDILHIEFPVSNRFGYISDVRTALLNPTAMYNIYLHTDRCIIFASCVDRKEYDIFSRMLKGSFIEKDARMMNLFYRLATRYDSSIWHFLPDLSWRFCSHNEYYRQIIQNEK